MWINCDKPSGFADFPKFFLFSTSFLYFCWNAQKTRNTRTSVIERWLNRGRLGMNLLCVFVYYVYYLAKYFFIFYETHNKKRLQFCQLYVIIIELDMRWSERLLLWDAATGNFRGVCPFNRAKGVYRKHCRLWLDAVRMNDLESPEFVGSDAGKRQFRVF